MLDRVRFLLISQFALLGVCLIISGGFDQDRYLYVVRGITEPPPYPWNGVAIFSAIAIFECVVVFWILRPETFYRSWRRALVVFALSFTLLLFWVMGIMHAPPYFLAHVFWLFIGVVLLFVLLVVSLYTAWRKAHNKTPQSPASQAGTVGSDAASGP